MKPRGFDAAFNRAQAAYDNMEPPDEWDDDDPDRPPTREEIAEAKGDYEWERGRDGDD
jgi:hypothetical protein